jgi:hypothetical protein
MAYSTRNSFAHNELLWRTQRGEHFRARKVHARFRFAVLTAINFDMEMRRDASAREGKSGTWFHSEKRS